MGEIIFQQSSTKFIILAVTHGVIIVVATCVNLISWLIGRTISPPNSILKQIFLSLVFVQIMEVVFTDTFNFITVILVDWNLGKNVCIFSMNIGLASTTMSTWLLTFLVLDRYLNSRFNRQYKYLSMKRLKLFGCLMWFGLLLIIVPVNYFISINVNHFDNETQSWHCHLPFELTPMLFHFIMRFALPLTIAICIFIYFKHSLKRNKVNIESLKMVTKKKADNECDEEVKVHRLQIPCDDWWNDINDKITAGPNNALPPISTNPTTKTNPQPLTRNENDGQVRLEANIDSKKVNSMFPPNVTLLLRDRLFVRRISLPDIRHNLMSRFSVPLMAWQNTLQLRRKNIIQDTIKENVNKISEDEIQPWHDNSSNESIKNSSDDRKNSSDESIENDIIMENTYKYRSDMTSEIDSDSLRRKTEGSTEQLKKLQDNSPILTKIKGKTQFVDKTERQYQHDKDLIQCVMQDHQCSNQGITEITEQDAVHSADNNYKSHKFQQKLGQNDIMTEKTESKFYVKTAQRQSDLITREKNNKKTQVVKSRLEEIQDNCKTGDNCNHVDAEDIESLNIKKEEKLINVFIAVIVINHLFSLPKLCLHLYVTLCDDCMADFVVFRCFHLIDNLIRSLTPILIIVSHEPFRYIMFFFLSCICCRSRRK